MFLRSEYILCVKSGTLKDPLTAKIYSYVLNIVQYKYLEIFVVEEAECGPDAASEGLVDLI